MLDFGRRVFGAAALLLGIASLALHDQLVSDWELPGGAAFLVVTSLAQIAGGLAIQFRRTEGLGAAVVGGVFLLFALTFVPDVVAQPAVYASWGNLFYPLAPVAGAAVAFCVSSPATPNAPAICRAAVMLLGLCNGSFAVEQVEFLARTASLVPPWLPPSGMFWTVATTIAFGLAAVALVVGYQALLAARLATLMLVIFGVAVWIPILIADPKTHSNWSEGLETFVIAGAAWIVAGFLGRENLLRA